MRLVYLGSGAFGLPTLHRLTAEHSVVLVVTQPDRPAGRHRHLMPTPVCQFGREHGLNTLKPPDVNDPSVAQEIDAAGADALVVIAYGQKLGPALLDDAFAINLHASLLPMYRGAAPINWAIINGETETGVSVIRISQRLDAGDVLAQRALRIDPMETAGELEQRLAETGPSLVLQTLSEFESEQLHPMRQDEHLASRAPKLTKSDGTVRFDQPAGAVQRRVHGLTPKPGCTVRFGAGLHGELRLLRMEILNEGQSPASPGELLGDGTVACAPGVVRLIDVQPPGGKGMSFEDYCRGHDLPVGCRFEEL